MVNQLLIGLCLTLPCQKIKKVRKQYNNHHMQSSSFEEVIVLAKRKSKELDQNLS
jgi:hypothetical protein